MGFLSFISGFCQSSLTSSPVQLATPGSFASTGQTDTTADFSWADVTGESSYQLQIATDAGFATIVQTITPAANATTATTTGLTASTTYYARLKAVGDGTSFTDSNYTSTVSFSTSASGAIDTDAQNFIDRVATAGYSARPFEVTAYDTYVKGLKLNGLWTKILDQGLFLGGLSQVANLVSLKGAVTQTAAGSPPFHHDGMGQDNGTSNYLRIGINPFTDLSYTNLHLGMYSRLAGYVANTSVLMGAREDYASSKTLELSGYRQDGNNVYQIGSAFLAGAYDPSNAGLIVVSKSGTSMSAYREGTLQHTVTDPGGGSLPNYELQLDGFNNAGTAGGLMGGAFCFWTAGQALTGTEVTALSNLVRNLQYSLFRGVIGGSEPANTAPTTVTDTDTTQAKIIMFGDSNTAFNTQLDALLDTHYATVTNDQNPGYTYSPGANSALNLMTTVLAQYDATKTKNIIGVMFSTNDIIANGSLSIVKSSALSIISSLKDAGFRVIVIVPGDPGHDPTASPTTYAHAVSPIIRGWLLDHCYNFLDVDAFVNIGADPNVGQYLTANASYYTDGTHYTSIGYERIAELVEPAVEFVYNNKRP